MKKILILAAFVFPAFAFAGGPSVLSSFVPQYMQGSNGTNNNRVPIWFWGQINGLTPGATYHYYTTMDTLNASATSNGAGNPYFINTTTGTVRRTTNASMTNNAGYDSLVASSVGVIEGWFGVEPTGNGRFTPGTVLYPKIMMNNGAGGTTVASRLIFSLAPVTVINMGTTSMSTTEGSALYDSLDAAEKNFICAYDNTLATGRPISIAIVEDDLLDLYAITSIANFYGTFVDTLTFHWGTIIPNNLPNGIRSLEERDFTTGMPIDTVTDSDGIWCYGTNTVNMSNDNTAMYLNSTFSLTSSVVYQDSTWTGISNSYNASSNSPNSTYSWDYGDSNTGTGASVTHTYISPGVYNLVCVISTGGCSDTISQTVVVELSTGIITPMPLSFQLMPNPTDGEFFIATKDNNEKLVNVMDLLGQIISSQTLTGNKVSIDVSGQPAGVYLVEVKDTVTGKSGVKKIVLQ